MKIKLTPSRAIGTVKAPPSKSMAHRLLICAGLSPGESTVCNVEPSEDVLATMDCLRAMGCRVQYKGDAVTVVGVDARTAAIGSILPCRECGSTLRFFVPIALLCGREVTLTGSRKLLSRPLGVYREMCKEKGYFYAATEELVMVKGPLVSGVYEVAGDVSSQFISGLLFALPLLEENSKICITGNVESRSYIDLTIAALEEFGVLVDWEDDQTLSIPGGQQYRSHDTEVEGDYSNAAFFSALDWMGGDVRVEGLSPDSLQGDRVYPSYFEEITKGTPTLDVTDCPDLAPVLMAMAAAHRGAILTGTARLRLKESDRGAAMAQELTKMGGDVLVEEDRITINLHRLYAPSTPLCGHNDHRIVMALSVLLSYYGGEINGAEAVAKSLPDFFDRLKRLGVKVETV